MKAKKVFIGIADIASFIGDWAYGFKLNKIDTIKGCVDYQSVVQNSKLDYIIREKQDRISYFRPGRISVKVKPWWDKKVKDYYFKKALKECDVFVFIWGSFYPDKRDYKIIRDAGKKIITLFVGGDIRWQPSMKQEFQRLGFPIIEYDNYDFSTNALNDKLEFLRVAEKYSNIILSQPNVMQLALRPYTKLSIPIIQNEFEENNNQRKIPIIVHAPTNATGKGSKYIEVAVEKLKKKGVVFEYIRINRMKREEALRVYRDSDIVIDQLLTPGGGKLAHECLAMGKVVLTFIGNDEYNQLIPLDCPLIDVRSETLYEKLKELISNVKLRTEIAAKGRPYIDKYHNPKKTVKLLMKQLESDNIVKTDYFPSFFREKFIPEPENIEVYNKWNDFVSNCSWYKENVKKGERDGLLF